MSIKRYVRCQQGHVFDANASELCPRCGSAAMPNANEGPSPEVIRRSPNFRKILVAGLTLVIVAGGAAAAFIVHDRNAACGTQLFETDRCVQEKIAAAQAKVHDDAQAAAKIADAKQAAEEAQKKRDEAAAAKKAADEDALKQKQQQADDAEKQRVADAAVLKQKQVAEAAEKQRLADDAALKQEQDAEEAQRRASTEAAQKAQADKNAADQRAAAAQKQADDAALKQKQDAEAVEKQRQADEAARKAQAEADAASARTSAAQAMQTFLTVDPRRAVALTEALLPLSPADVTPKMDAISPTPLAETLLQLSRALRHALGVERSIRLVQAQDFPGARRILEVIGNDETISAGSPNVFAKYGLGFVLSTRPMNTGERTEGIRLMLAGAQGGVEDAIEPFDKDASFPASIGLDQGTLLKLTERGVVQNPRRFQNYLQTMGADPAPFLKLRNDLLAAAGQDVQALALASNAIADFSSPSSEDFIANRLLILGGQPNTRQRLMIGTLTGALARLNLSRSNLSSFYERGVGGLPVDLPNAALWLCLIISGTNDQMAAIPYHLRYVAMRGHMTPSQQSLVDQVALSVGVSSEGVRVK